MSGANDAERLLARVTETPDVCVQKLDTLRDAALLVEFTADTYRQASFLDDRVLHAKMAGGWVPLARLVERAGTISTGVPLHFIFHSGHVGSTLLSRLLEEIGRVLSLREPLPLRSLAEMHDVLDKAESLINPETFDVLLEVFLRLWGRGYPDTRMAIVKATSSTGRLAPVLLARRPAARAVYLNLNAETYLATLLGGQSAGVDLRGHGPERIRRLQAYGLVLEAPYHRLSPGELSAMSWLAESWSRRRTLAQGGARVLPIDFDGFLSDLPGHLARILAHFGLPADAATVARVAESPALTKYSKAQQHGYTSETRAQILRQARAQHAGEIAKGLGWLDRAARANAEAAAIVGGA